MAAYVIEICKEDGSTPLGECPRIEVEAQDPYAAQAQVLSQYPGYEVVSWGLKADIEDYCFKFGLAVPSCISLPA